MRDDTDFLSSAAHYLEKYIFTLQSEQITFETKLVTFRPAHSVRGEIKSSHAPVLARVTSGGIVSVVVFLRA